ncbi:MAG TPA: S24 family peptidase [Pyrinomonadaceae bacterium]|jgi:SOS-response transcriptional repressor LexA
MKDSTLFRGKLDLTHKIEGFRMTRATGIPNAIGIRHAGNTLSHLGIFDNDLLVIKPETEYETGDNKLYVLDTPNGKTAKFVESAGDENSITLTNKAGWRQTWQIAEVTCIGVVIRVERDFV